eukprot:1160489-Pelagomonas_calceolata.AAC.5
MQSDTPEPEAPKLVAVTQVLADALRVLKVAKILLTQLHSLTQAHHLQVAIAGSKQPACLLRDKEAMQVSKHAHSEHPHEFVWLRGQPLCNGQALCGEILMRVGAAFYTICTELRRATYG